MTFTQSQLTSVFTRLLLKMLPQIICSALFLAFSAAASGTQVATPTFNPAAGTYTSARSVTISDTTTGATIYFTTSGTAPTTISTKYTAAISVSATETLEAIAVVKGDTNSLVATAKYTINKTAATPTFSPAAGTYTSVQSVTISDTTTGATIYYTTSGTAPTTGSTKYTAAISVSATETLEAIAVATGYTNSSVATAKYTINKTVATPTFSPAAGTYTSTQSVTISDTTTGATIYYTTSGTTPTTGSTKYTAAISVSATETIEAIAVATGYTNSSVATAVYTINKTVATPTFSPVAGTYTSAQSVTISDTTTGATIYYTTGGTAPTTGSTKYSAAISVSATETLEAIAVATGYTNSSVATAKYTINKTVATPTFSPAAGTYTSTQSVTISDTTTGATIYYTTSGTTPTTGSTKYTAAIPVSATETLEAIAVATGYTNSSVATAKYTISAITNAATPTFAPAAGTYTSPQPVTISDTTTGATIYYTTNGTAPTTGSSVYSSEITVSSSATVEAIATATGYANSPIATAAYTISPTSLPGYTVSGTVTYSGALTGWVYLELIPTSGCSSCGGMGTAINATTAGSLVSGMAFTIHGVPSGTYTLEAWLDNIGYGAANASNPTGNLSSVAVTSANLSGKAVTLANPAAVSLGTSTPTWDTSEGFGAFNGDAVVGFDKITSNDVEMPASYELEYSTSSTFSGTVGSKCFPAVGVNYGPWIVTGLTNGDTYYFRAAGNTGACGSSTTGLTYSAIEPSGGLLIGAPTTGNLVSGTVTFTAPSGGITGPLYVGCYTGTGAVYGDPIASPVSPQAYSMYVPTGTNCIMIGFIDQNNTGIIGGPGEISNATTGIGAAQFNLTGAMPNENLTLPNGNSVATLRTYDMEQINLGGVTTYSYAIDFRVNGLYKLPVSVELFSETPEKAGAAADVVLPSDIATDALNAGSGEHSNAGSDKFDLSLTPTGTPVASDSYAFKVTYSDATSETLNASISAVLDTYPFGLSPAGTGIITTPNFDWAGPSPASDYVYQFNLMTSGYSSIWEIVGEGLNGFPYTIDAINWSEDPTGTNSTPNVSSLSTGTQYEWYIQAADSNGNEATTEVAFETTTSSLTLSTNGGLVGPALAGSPFTAWIQASGGSGSGYTFSVNGTSISDTSLGSASSFTGNDGLLAYYSGSMLYIVGTPTTAETINLAVTVTDNVSDTASQVYSLIVSSGPGASGVKNALLNGTYVCKMDGYYDINGAPWSALLSFVTSGSAGTFTNGVFDTNSSKDSTEVSGTASGTYSIGSDYMGLLTLNAVLTTGATGSQTTTWGIALNDANGATTTATEFRMTEIDDVGTSPSGQHGAGVCYQATTGDFNASAVSGSFVFSLNGVNGSGVPSASLNLISASSGTVASGGYSDGYTLGNTSETTLTYTGGSITTPNTATGRSTLTLTTSGGTGTFAVYVIDTNRMFILMSGAVEKAQSGDMRRQLQAANTAAVLLDGSSVLYMQGYQGTSGGSVTGFNSSVYQVSNVSSGTYTSTQTVNASYDDDAGTYTAGRENGTADTVTLNSANPGRATFTVNSSGSAFFYFYNVGSALYLELNGSNYYMESGWLEAQTQPASPPFSNANIAGSYVTGKLPRQSSGNNDTVGEGTFYSNGIGSGSEILANDGTLQWDQAFGDVMGYNWLSTTYGALSNSVWGMTFESCVVITPVKSGATGKVACIENTSPGANVDISEQ